MTLHTIMKQSDMDRQEIRHLLRRKLFRPLALWLLLYMVGMGGYAILEYREKGWFSVRECFYQTGTLLTSVGFEDLLRSYTSTPAAIFTVSLSVIGIGILLYMTSTITAFVLSGELSALLVREKRKKMIDSMSGHFICCGYGDTGQHCVQDITGSHASCVVIEKNPDRLEQLRRHYGEDTLFVSGDATEDEVQLQAGLTRAHGLISALPNDRDNLLAVITARQLNPNLRIITRCIEPANVRKLEKAGADSVVCINRIGGLRLSSEMIRPQVISFLDKMMNDSRGIRMEEWIVTPDSRFADVTLAEAKLSSIAAVNVVAMISPQSSDIIYNPRGNTMLLAGTTVVLIGTASELGTFLSAVRPSTS